jgi:hypothetical protein
LARCALALETLPVLLRSDAERLLADRNPEAYIIAGKALEEVGLANRHHSGTALDSLARPDVLDVEGGIRKRLEERQADIQIARLLVEHLRREALLSWGGHSIPEPHEGTARFSGYPFTAFGWSYLAPLLNVNEGKVKPCPVLIDVWTNECDRIAVASLNARLDRVRRGRTFRVLGVIAARGFLPNAFKLARSTGLMTLDLRQVFGDRMLSVLKEISTLVDSNPSPDVAGDGVERLNSQIAGLAGHPFVQDLKSIGLEAVAALVARSEGFEGVSMGKMFKFGDRDRREADVFGQRGGVNEIIVIECKAHRGDMTLDSADVRKFFKETVPAALGSMVGQQPKICRAEIWTTGVIGADAESALAELSLKRLIVPRLLGKTQVLAAIPSSLRRCQRLVETIASID